MRKEKKYHFIYKTTNLLSGRYYYGMHSSDILEDDYLGSGTYLRLAINKHGKKNFTREILEFCKSRKELKSREANIVTLQEVANKDCMNLRVGGSGENYKPIITSETRKKMSISAMGNSSHLGHFHSEETKLKLRASNMGRIHSIETCIKISESNMGRIVSEITRRKISQSNIGNYHTKESKQKMSESHKGKTFTDEHCRKISIANKNPSEETRYKQGSGKRGKKLTNETKKRISEANSNPQKRITCPRCNKTGGSSNMKRYHFDNCKK